MAYRKIPLRHKNLWRKGISLYAIKIPEKTSHSEPHPLDPRKSWEKTSQSEPHPLDPRKSWKKPHNLSPIARIPENPGKNLTILRICLVGWLVGWLVGSDKLCRGPLRGQLVCVSTLTVSQRYIHPSSDFFLRCRVRYVEADDVGHDVRLQAPREEVVGQILDLR